ncbi:MAG: hypothetical protein D6782_05950, partial [Alphaproteobacteria bacterium]
NEAVAGGIAADPALADMGCTLVAAAIDGGMLDWISVGDSALLLVREDGVQRLNADHSMRAVLADMVEKGRMDADVAARSPGRHALRSAVSGGPIKLIDRSPAPVALHAGDVLLLASDGLDTLAADTLAALVAKARDGDAPALAAAILAQVQALAGPKQDNTTVVCYRPVPPAGARHASPPPTAGKGGALAALKRLLTGKSKADAAKPMTHDAAAARMRRRAGFWPVGALSAAAMLGAMTAASADQAPAADKPVAYGLTVMDGERTRAQGAAVALTPDGWLITSAALVKSADERLLVTDASGWQAPARLVARDKAWDLAILRVDAQGLASIPIAATSIATGAPVHAVLPAGAGGDGGDVVRGAVGATVHATIKSGGKRIEGVFLSHNALFGASGYGSPLLDDCGALVGMNRTDPTIGGGLFSRRDPLDAPTTHAIALPAARIAALLADHDVPYARRTAACVDEVRRAQDAARAAAEKARAAEERARALAEKAEADA